MSNRFLLLVFALAAIGGGLVAIYLEEVAR